MKPRETYTHIKWVVIIYQGNGNTFVFHISQYQFTTIPLSYSHSIVLSLKNMERWVDQFLRRPDNVNLNLSLRNKDYVSFDKHGSKKPVKQGDNEQFALKFQEHDLKISGIEENLKKSKKQLAVELSLLTITVSGLLRRMDYLETVLGIRSKDEGRSNVMTTITPGPWTGDLGDVIRGPGSNEPAGGSYVSMMTDGSAVVVPTHMGLPTPTHLPPPNN